jgi:hypothetical protein
LQKTETVENQLNRLVDIGFRLALDDYGTGYSSISYLKKFPIHTIKIDRSFIQNVTIRKEDEVIIKSIIELGKGLNKNIVAEGVETQEQFDWLKKCGCHEIQGYLFSKAVPAAKMGELFLQDVIYPNQQTIPAVERRRYYRVRFPMSLSAQLTILSYKGKELSFGSTEVLVQDIGLGGLRFMSHLKLILRPDIVYGFYTIVMGIELKLSGKIVWSRERKMGIYEYGVEFLIEEKDRDKLTALLHDLSFKLRSNPLFNDGHFITENALTYIKKQFENE